MPRTQSTTPTTTTTPNGTGPMTLTLPRQGDTKNYAKFAAEAGTGKAFGSVYVPIAEATGITSLVVTARRD